MPRGRKPGYPIVCVRDLCADDWTIIAGSLSKTLDVPVQLSDMFDGGFVCGDRVVNTEFDECMQSLSETTLADLDGAERLIHTGWHGYVWFTPNKAWTKDERFSVVKALAGAGIFYDEQ